MSKFGGKTSNDWKRWSNIRNLTKSIEISLDLCQIWLDYSLELVDLGQISLEMSSDFVELARIEGFQSWIRSSQILEENRHSTNRRQFLKTKKLSLCFERFFIFFFIIWNPRFLNQTLLSSKYWSTFSTHTHTHTQKKVNIGAYRSSVVPIAKVLFFFLFSFFFSQVLRALALVVLKNVILTHKKVTLTILTHHFTIHLHQISYSFIQYIKIIYITH